MVFVWCVCVARSGVCSIVACYLFVVGMLLVCCLCHACGCLLVLVWCMSSVCLMLVCYMFGACLVVWRLLGAYAMHCYYLPAAQLCPPPSPPNTQLHRNCVEPLFCNCCFDRCCRHCWCWLCGVSVVFVWCLFCACLVVVWCLRGACLSLV